MAEFNPFGQMLQSRIASDQFNQQKEQNAFARQRQGEADVRAQGAYDQQTQQFDQAEAMKRLELVGKTGPGFLNLDPQKQAATFSGYAQALNQVLPGTVPDGMQYSPDTVNLLSEKVRQYQSMQTPAKTGSSTDIGNYAQLAEDQWNIDNPGVPMPPREKMQAMMDIKRAQDAEIRKTTQAKADVDLDMQPKIKGASKFAEMSGSSRSQTIDKGYSSIQGLKQNLRNLDKAIEAVNAGAGTGAIAKRFPSIRGTSVLLDQVQGTLALDVIGSVTFGALSEGELNLAKSIAIPTGLEGPELVKWLQDRKSAQNKLIGYMEEQIDFLDQGGTVAGFIRSKKREDKNVIKFDANGEIIQ